MYMYLSFLKTFELNTVLFPENLNMLNLMDHFLSDTRTDLRRVTEMSKIYRIHEFIENSLPIR